MKRKKTRKKKVVKEINTQPIGRQGPSPDMRRIFSEDGGDLGCSIPTPIASDTVIVYTLRSALGYIFAFQHPAVMTGKNIPIHCKHLAGALKLTDLSDAIQFKYRLESHLQMKYEIEKLEMELRSYSLQSSSLSLAGK